MAPVKGDSKLEFRFAGVPGPERVAEGRWLTRAPQPGFAQEPALMKTPNLAESKMASCGSFFFGGDTEILIHKDATQSMSIYFPTWMELM